MPSNTGVCTDVIIRAYRKLGIDLQKEVHEDMKTNFDKYPKKSEDKQRNLIIHNIGAGQVLEDCLFQFKIIGHYSYKK